MIPIYQIEIIDHQAKIGGTHYEAKCKFVKSLANGIYDVYIEKHSEVRYGKMDRYYWGVIIPMILDASGSINSASNRDDLHDQLISEFGLWAENIIQRMNLWLSQYHTKRYSKMTVAERFIYIERIRIWATEFFGIVIPDPDPEWKKAAK